MLNPIVSKPIARMAAAVLVAGAIAFAITAAPAANDFAPTQTQDAQQPETVAKADHLRVPVKGAACSVHGWPAFEQKCQFDLREPGGEARTVRVIALR
jgi:hypothetical protein